VLRKHKEGKDGTTVFNDELCEIETDCSEHWGAGQVPFRRFKDQLEILKREPPQGSNSNYKAGKRKKLTRQQTTTSQRHFRYTNEPNRV
jgi:hypothetical protein